MACDAPCDFGWVIFELNLLSSGFDDDDDEPEPVVYRWHWMKAALADDLP